MYETLSHFTEIPNIPQYLQYRTNKYVKEKGGIWFFKKEANPVPVSHSPSWRTVPNSCHVYPTPSNLRTDSDASFTETSNYFTKFKSQ